MLYKYIYYLEELLKREVNYIIRKSAHLQSGFWTD